jgi:hypothetical protein
MEMAFNPLHMFRKRQKTLLAILTIGTMFLFVLGSGIKGDIFSRDWWGGRRGDENYLKTSDGREFTLDGKKVSLGDLDDLRLERRLAATYLAAAHQSAFQKIAAELQTYEKTPPTDVLADKKLRDLQAKAQQLQFKGLYYGQFLPFQANKVDELLDFKMWRDKAKELGLAYLSDGDVDRIINEMTDKRADLGEALDGVRTFFARQVPGLTTARIYDALRDEFSVRQAKVALLGSEKSPDPTKDPLSMLIGRDAGDVSEVAAAATPYERYEEFRKNRTTNYFFVMTLPVEQFLAEVTKEPSEDELRTLFDRYKDDEYSPDSARPGFKEPRRISLEWVSGRADSDFYKEQARALAPLPISFLPTPLVSLSAQDLAVMNEYHNKTANLFSGDPSYRLPPLTDPNFVLPLYRSLYHPENVTSMIGLGAKEFPLAVVAGGQSAAAAMDAKREANAVAREINKRIAVGASLVASSTNPLTLTTPALWARIASEKQYLPLDAVRDELVREADARYAHSLLALNLAKLQKELETKRFRPKEAREWLAKTLPEYGLTQHVVVVDDDGETMPLGQYEISAEPQMQPFKDAYLRQNGTTDAKAEEFAAQFFAKDPAGKSGPYVAKEWPRGVLDPGRLSTEEEAFLWWKTEDDKAAFTTDFEKARPKVKAAWRLSQARDKAKAKAEQLRSEAEATGGDLQKLRDLAKKHNLKDFQLDGVARLVGQNAAFGDLGRNYKPFQLPPGTLPHSDPKTQDQVLEKLLATQRKGDAVIFTNQPRDQFFVATVVDRLDPDLDGFYKAYRDSTKPPMIKDQLFDTLAQQRREDYRQKLLNEMRARVGAVDDKGQFDVDADQKQEIEKRLSASRS